MTFLIILGVIETCSFRLVLEGKTGKEIPEPSRLEFLEKFLASNFTSSDAEDNTSGSLNRGVIADLPLLRTLLAIHQKSWESSFWEMNSFALLAYASLGASRTLLQWLLACLNFTLDSEDLFCWYRWEKWFLWQGIKLYETDVNTLMQCLICTNDFCFPKMFFPIGSNFVPVQSKEDHFWIEMFYHHSTPIFNLFLFEGVWAKCKSCLVTWYIFSVLSMILMFIMLYHFFHHQKVFHYICVHNLLFFGFNSSGNEFHNYTNTCIPKVIDWMNFLLYQVVLSFCCLIVFCFTLNPRMSLDI